MNRDNAFLRGLYERIGQADFFQNLAEELDAFLGLGNVQVELVNVVTGQPGTPHFSRPIRPERLAEYDAVFHASSPRLSKTLLTPGVLLPDWKLVDPEIFDRTEFGAWLDQPDVDNRWCVDCALPLSGEVSLQLAAIRGRRLGPYEDAELGPFQSVLQTVRRAADLHLRLTAAEDRELTYARALSVRSEGYVFLDEAGRVIGLNAAAERFLRERMGVTIRSGRVCAAHAADEASFEEALRAADAALLRGDLDTKLVIPLRRSPDGGRVRAKFAPLSHGPRPPGTPPRARVVLFLDDLAKPVGTLLEPLAKLGLTKAECSLALELANGTSLKQAAEARSVAHETARSQLKSIMQKLEVSRQADLLRVLSQFLA